MSSCQGQAPLSCSFLVNGDLISWSISGLPVICKHIDAHALLKPIPLLLLQHLRAWFVGQSRWHGPLSDAMRTYRRPGWQQRCRIHPSPMDSSSRCSPLMQAQKAKPHLRRPSARQSTGKPIAVTETRNSSKSIDITFTSLFSCCY